METTVYYEFTLPNKYKQNDLAYREQSDPFQRNLDYELLFVMEFRW